jgi:hypothetical protein
MIRSKQTIPLIQIFLLSSCFFLPSIRAEEWRKTDLDGNIFILENVTGSKSVGYRLKILLVESKVEMKIWFAPPDSIDLINDNRPSTLGWPDKVYLDGVCARDGFATILSFLYRDGEVGTAENNDFWLIRAPIKNHLADNEIPLPEFIKIIGFPRASQFFDLQSRFELVDPFTVSMFNGRGFIPATPTVQVQWPKGVRYMTGLMAKSRSMPKFLPYREYKPPIAIAKGRKTEKGVPGTREAKP